MAPEPSSYFVSPLHSRDQLHTLRAKQIKSQKGRSGRNYGNETDTTPPDSTAPNSGPEVDSPPNDHVNDFTAINQSRSQSSASLPALSESDSDPEAETKRSWPFPHRTNTAPQPPKITKSKVEENLSKLNPALYLPSGTDVPINDGSSTADATVKLRRQHLDVLVTIIHTCMSKGDYDRAKSAYSLLLRSYPRQTTDDGIKIRNDWYWAIGVELLFRTGNKPFILGGQTGPAAEANADGDDIQDPEASGILRVTDDPEIYDLAHLPAAKDYFDRLNLEYTWDKNHPLRVDVRLFQLNRLVNWIFVVTGNSGKKNIAVLRVEKEEAGNILKDIKGLQASPPFASDITMWKLQADVLTWLSDLELQIAKHAKDASQLEADDAEHALVEEDDDDGAGESASQQRLSPAERAQRRADDHQLDRERVRLKTAELETEYKRNEELRRRQAAAKLKRKRQSRGRR